MIMQKVWRKTSIKTSVHDIRKKGSRLLWEQPKFCADLFRKSILPFLQKHTTFSGKARTLFWKKITVKLEVLFLNAFFVPF